MRINLARIVKSPSLNAQTYKVYRSQGVFQEGGWAEVAQVPAFFYMYGVIVPASEREIRQLPEADRIMQGMMFWSSVELYTTRTGQYQGTSDKVEWQGELYKIMNCNQFVDYGFWSALGQRLAGD